MKVESKTKRDFILLSEMQKEDSYFTPITLLGRGGFGKVWSAQNSQEIGQPLYALKQVPLGRRIDISLFLREVEIHQRLDHPNIIKFHSWWISTHGKSFLQMPMINQGMLDAP